MALQRAGIPKHTISAMCESLQRMIHVVRTAYGDSTDSYGGDDKGGFTLPCMGLFQGNKAGPQIWAIISSTIFDVLRKQGYGVRFCSALSKATFILCGFSYVDDCDLVCIGDGSDINIVFSKMQNMLHWIHPKHRKLRRTSPNTHHMLHWVHPKR